MSVASAPFLTVMSSSESETPEPTVQLPTWVEQVLDWGEPSGDEECTWTSPATSALIVGASLWGTLWVADSVEEAHGLE